MGYRITVQKRTKQKDMPTTKELKKWACFTLQIQCHEADITLRIVDTIESTALNQKYRHKTGPTNVLSFAYTADPVQGDIALCAPVITEQAKNQGKPCKMHWAHLIVHGCLHLLGYDHQTDEEAATMQTVEKTLLHQLGFHEYE